MIAHAPIDPALRSIFDHLPPVVRIACRRMALADEELTQAGDPPGLFEILRPSPIFAEYPHDDALYIVHCRELIARAKAGEDMRPGTKAEVLGALLRASLIAPLRAQGQALAERLFADLFPERATTALGEPAREQWAGQIAEDLSAARRKLAQSWRRA